ncbi:hypothetical protein ACTWPB_02620 [Nocardia sp. IBHARD005]|uniref:hypothetical protein n=1 Tax=Nocardia sp. IBHARD005 TaxID=3457765 RepID=UPI0040581F87
MFLHINGFPLGETLDNDRAEVFVLEVCQGQLEVPVIALEVPVIAKELVRFAR